MFKVGDKILATNAVYCLDEIIIQTIESEILAFTTHCDADFRIGGSKIKEAMVIVLWNNNGKTLGWSITEEDISEYNINTKYLGAIAQLIPINSIKHYPKEIK